MYYKVLGQRIRLKEGVVPHKNLTLKQLHSKNKASQVSPETKRRKMTRIESLIASATTKPIFDNKQHETILVAVLPTPSPAALVVEQPSSSAPSTSTAAATTTANTEESYKSSSSSLSDDSSNGNKKRPVGQNNNNIVMLERKSRFYLGLPPGTYFLVDLLVEYGEISAHNVLITLKKIRLNDEFVRLGYDFNITDEKQVERIFRKSVPIMAHLLRQLICFPFPNIIMRQLPLHFRSKYYKVATLVDLFEIEIEKPSDIRGQMLTWSTNYQAHTLKYLIATTPNGLITFISEGFGGRISDKLIFEESGFLDAIPHNASIMGGGHMPPPYILARKSCILVRLPATEKNNNKDLLKDQIKLKQQMTTLRIHIERVIGRIREFHMLLPHAGIDNNLLHLMDQIVLIVGGIVNMQQKVIE